MIWRGEIYQVDLGRPGGHEPAFLRPAIGVSSDIVNNSPGNLVVVVPLTSTDYGMRSHVEIRSGSQGSGGRLVRKVRPHQGCFHRTHPQQARPGRA